MLEDAGTAVAVESREPADFYDGLPQASQDIWDAIAAKGWTPGHISLGFVADKDGEQLGPFESIGDLYSCVCGAIEEDFFATNDANGGESEEEPIVGEIVDEDPCGVNDDDAISDEVVDEIRGHLIGDFDFSTSDEDEKDAQASPAALCGTPGPKGDGKYCRQAIGHEGKCVPEQPPSVEIEIDEDHNGNRYLDGIKPVVDKDLKAAAFEFRAFDEEWSEAGKKRSAAKAALETFAFKKKDLFHVDPNNSKSLIYQVGGLLIRQARESKTVVSVEVEKETVAKGPKNKKGNYILDSLK